MAQKNHTLKEIPSPTRKYPSVGSSSSSTMKSFPTNQERSEKTQVSINLTVSFTKKMALKVGENLGKELASTPLDDVNFKQLTDEQMDMKTPEVVASVFAFAKNLAKEVGGEVNAKEMECFIIKEILDKLGKKLKE